MHLRIPAKLQQYCLEDNVLKDKLVVKLCPEDNVLKDKLVVKLSIWLHKKISPEVDD